MGSSDNLSNLRSQDIKGSDSFIILVLSHVESFDVFWIVVEDNRFVEDEIAKIFFVFGGQIDSPLNWVLKRNSFFNTLEKYVNGFGIGSSGEWAFNQLFQIFQVSWLALIEKFKVLSAVFKNEFDAELNVGLSAFHDIIHISKSQFRLDHPELSCMPGGMRHFCSEGWAKSVDVRESTTIVLNSQLSRYCQSSGLFEELLRVIDFSIDLRDILDQARFWQNG